VGDYCAAFLIAADVTGMRRGFIVPV